MSKKEGCSVKKVVCPRCKTEFEPDTELIEEHQHKKEKNEELNVLASCPACGNKTRLEF